MKQFDRSELLELFSAALDGRLSVEEERKLNEALTDPELAAEYARYAGLFAALTIRISSQEALTEARRSARRPMPAATRRSSRRAWIAAALIVLAIGIGMTLIVKQAWNRHERLTRPVQSFATVIDARDAVFVESGMPATPGAQLPGGFIRLESGEVDIEFFSGAQVTVTGPASFGINSPMRGFLEHGHAAVYCPEQALGFTVGAPGMSIVDLGTRFTLRVTDRKSSVHVTEGRVRIERDSGPAVELAERDALVLDTKGQTLGRSISIAASQGRGFASYMDGETRKPRPGVWVKRTGQRSSPKDRISFIRFDLAPLDAAVSADPQLEMLIRWSEGLPDDVDVWALPDDHPDAQGPIAAANWSGPSSPWRPDGSFESRRLVHLGKLAFSPDLADGSAVRFSSKALTEAVRQRAGGVITLVLSTDHVSRMPAAFRSPMLIFNDSAPGAVP